MLRRVTCGLNQSFGAAAYVDFWIGNYWSKMAVIAICDGRKVAKLRMYGKRLAGLGKGKVWGQLGAKPDVMSVQKGGGQG